MTVFGDIIMVSVTGVYVVKTLPSLTFPICICLYRPLAVRVFLNPAWTLLSSTPAFATRLLLYKLEVCTIDKNKF